MQLHEAGEIREVFGPERVNAALIEGWKIIAVTTATRQAFDGPVMDVCYTLGKPAAKTGTGLYGQPV